jgi:hypothetical protein
MWHFEEIEVKSRLVVGRFVRPPGHPDKHTPPDAVVSANIDGTSVFLFAAKSHPQLSVREWRDLVRQLRKRYGVTVVTADREGRDFNCPTDRAW